MKTPTTANPRMNPIRRLIQDATQAPAKDLALIENILRDEIFHSTLDWQTRELLCDAAQQAFARLNADRELYEFSRASGVAQFHKMRGESVSN